MNCPECGDDVSGRNTVVTSDRFTVCRECGCVLDDESKYINYPVFDVFPERITMLADIDFVKRKYSLNKLNRNVKSSGWAYIIAWHEITRILAIFNLGRLASGIFDQFKKVFNSFPPGSGNKMPYSLAPAVILQTLQEMDINVTMSEIAEHVECDYKKLKTVYNRMRSVNGYVTTDVRVRKHIKQYSHLTIISGKITIGAIELYKRYGSMMSNRRPSTIASVCVILSYYMQTQFDEAIPKNQLCKKMDVFPLSIVPLLSQFGKFFFNEPLWVSICPRLLDSSVNFIPKTHDMYTGVIEHV